LIGVQSIKDDTFKEEKEIRFRSSQTVLAPLAISVSLTCSAYHLLFPLSLFLYR
jgi:hypothetical protein